MRKPSLRFRPAQIGLDSYMLLLVLTILLAALFPARDQAASLIKQVTHWAVALLFFLYGAKLSTESILSGMTNWKLQAAVLALTYVLFPALAVVVNPVASLWLPAAIGLGFLYVGVLPSTVQSSIAFTAVSGGNVGGSVCAASISNLLSVGLTPVLLAVLLPKTANHGIDLGAVWSICKQILLPFALGQLCRPFLAGILARNKRATMVVDRGSILLIIYSAFSAGMVSGVWSQLSPAGLLLIIALCLGMFGFASGVAVLLSKGINLPRADLLTLLYCGSTKSLATGLPLAGILFQGSELALIVLPLMIYHLLQLVLCALLSQRLAATAAGRPLSA